MTRTRRTPALFAAAVLALGVTACSPPSENDSAETSPVTEVTPDSGYEGAGVATGGAEADNTSAEPTEGAEDTVVVEEGVVIEEEAVVGGTEPAEAPGA
ncbi:MAG: hypothetical protein ACTH1D_08945 [Mycobacteriaceae bacterium]|uniref:hypothetical protein n=1 Tax=Corynebacterium sp. TaxID=1720 RepID=UPI003F96B046